jgi:hypothetical protein
MNNIILLLLFLVNILNGPFTVFFEIYQNNVLLFQGTNTVQNGIYPIILDPLLNQKIILYFNIPPSS